MVKSACRGVSSLVPGEYVHDNGLYLVRATQSGTRFIEGVGRRYESVVVKRCKHCIRRPGFSSQCNVRVFRSFSLFVKLFGGEVAIIEVAKKVA